MEMKVGTRVGNHFHYADLRSSLSFFSDPCRAVMVFVTCHNLCSRLSTALRCAAEWAVFLGLH